MKKTLAILLSLALVICMIPGTAFANTPDYTSTVQTKITVEEVEYAVSLTGTQVTYNGSPQRPTLTLTATTTTDKTKPEPTLKYVPLSGSAIDSVTDAGTYKVYATISSTDYYVGDFVIAQYDLGKVNVLIDDVVTELSSSALWSDLADVTNFYYNGNKIASDNAIITKIKEGVTLALSGPSGTTYTATFTTTDTTNFSGTISATTFDKVININGTTVTDTAGKALTNNTVNGGVYSGTDKDVKGLFKLYADEAKTVPLYYGTDYSVVCADPKNADTDEVITIKGIGKYGSTKTIYLDIDPRDAATYVTYDAIGDQTVGTLNSIEPVIKDRYLGTTLVKGTDYVIASRSGQAGEKGAVVVSFINNYSGDLTIPFNVVSDAYNVAAMSVYQGTTALTSGSTASAFMYNGSSQPLAGITVYTDYANKKTLSSYYYTVSYEYTDPTTNKIVSTTSPVNATTYNVYIVGQNGYAGKKHIGTYTIPKYNMDYVTITVGMGSAVAKPVVTVKSSFENIYFTEDKDYTMSYYVSSYTNKVLVTVTPTSTGNLTGSSSSEYYPIVAKSINTCSAYFTNGKSSSAYTGSAISVPITVKDGYYTTLAEGTHYTVTYKDALGKTVYSIKDAGTYTIEIAGKGMYDGKLYLTYTVTGTDISYYTVTLKDASVKADGYNKIPTITSVKYGYYSSLSSSDYTVTYKNYLGQTVTSMSAPGTYTVVVTGKNGYQGSATTTFTIVGLDQEVTITNGTSKKVYEDSDSFKLTAKATGDGTGFTWTTSDPTVATVSYDGTITVKGVGRAKITATTTGNKKYNPEDASFIVKVYPDKAKMTKKPWTDGKKGQLKVRWGYQEGVTKYQIRYSTTSSFKSYTTKTVSAHGDSTLATQSTTLKNLKSGKKYYVKVRAVYQTYNEEGTKITYYGAWSPWRSAKTK